MEKISKILAVLCSLLLVTGVLGCNKRESANGSDSTPKTNLPAEIVGVWYYGAVSSTNYINPDGSWNNSIGAGQSYTFNASGTFEFGYRNYATIGTCENIGMAFRKGTVSFGRKFIHTDGAGNSFDAYEFTVYDNYSKIMEQHTCTQSSNYDRDNTKYIEIYQAIVGIDSYGTPGLYLCRISPDQTNWSFFKKK